MIKSVFKNIERKSEPKDTLLHPNCIYVMSDVSLKASLLLFHEKKDVMDIRQEYQQNLNNSFIIMDEIDLMADSLKSELNYPISDKKKRPDFFSKSAFKFFLTSIMDQI